MYCVVCTNTSGTISCVFCRGVGEDGSLEFGRDVNACRFVDGVRETPNAEVNQLKQLFSLAIKVVDGCVQLHCVYVL